MVLPVVGVVLTLDAALMMYMQFFFAYLFVLMCLLGTNTNFPKVTSLRLRGFACGRCGFQSRGCADDVHAVLFCVPLCLNVFTWDKYKFPQSDVP